VEGQAVFGGIAPKRAGKWLGRTAIRVQDRHLAAALEDSMSRHLADHRSRTTGGRLKHFLRLARTPRETWQRPRGKSGSTRLIQFLRIARGRTV
jgi:hypothetical protein